MKALHDLGDILRSIAREVEVLPAVGGAVEDLNLPELEEREDQALNEKERVFKAIFEDGSMGRGLPVLGFKTFPSHYGAI